MAIQIRCIGAEKSKDRAIGILSSVFSHYKWQDDAETYGREEWWMGYMNQLNAKDIITDDCDGYAGLVIDLLFFIGRFHLRDLAECVVDINRVDDNLFDHHVGAVRIDGKWWHFHCWSEQLLTEDELTRGLYTLPSGGFPVPIKIVQHRICDQRADKWEKGAPK